MNNQEKILLAFAAAQAMKIFSDTCKNSGIKVSKDVVLKTWNKVSETLWVSKTQIAEIWTLIQIGKTQEDIQKIITQKYFPETSKNSEKLIPQKTENNNISENNSIEDKRKYVLEVIEKIKNKYIQAETNLCENFWKDLEKIYQDWEKKSWRHIKKILKVSQEANAYLDYQDAKTDLELQLTIQCIHLDSQITADDIELYYFYAKYKTQKKWK